MHDKAIFGWHFFVEREVHGSLKYARCQSQQSASVMKRINPALKVVWARASSLSGGSV